MNTLQSQPDSWLSSYLESRSLPEKGGFAVYATQSVPEGTLLAMFGGTIVTGDYLVCLPDRLQRLSIQVAGNLFLVSVVPGPGDYINHSCDPNAGLLGQIGLVAMRDIQAGEEITFDYAMSDSAAYDEFDCACGSPHCRGRITGTDWQQPVLWQRYRGYFSPYLQQKINERQSSSRNRLRE